MTEPVLGVAQQGEAAARGLVQPVLVQQQAEARLAAAPDPAAQLVKLGEAEALGMLDHHHGRARHVHADLDHRGRDEQARAAGGEIGERGVAHRRVLLAVREPHLGPEPLAQRGEAFLGGGEVARLALGHLRADPVDLRAAIERAGHRVHHVDHGREGMQRGADRLPARRASRRAG